jgi:peptidoglycan/LPS O-acetylase OafA/YrhL
VVQYGTAIDGLSAVAVLAVCIVHLKTRWLPDGFVRVDIFVIRDYLITSIVLFGSIRLWL